MLAAPAAAWMNLLSSLNPMEAHAQMTLESIWGWNADTLHTSDAVAHDRWLKACDIASWGLRCTLPEEKFVGHVFRSNKSHLCITLVKEVQHDLTQ